MSPKLLSLTALGLAMSAFAAPASGSPNASNVPLAQADESKPNRPACRNAASTGARIGSLRECSAADYAPVADSAAHAQARAETKKAENERTICKRVKTTGSRLNTQKLCATVAEWEEMSRETND